MTSSSLPHSHAIVWMDLCEARVFRFPIDDARRRRIRSGKPFRRIRHEAGAIGASHTRLDRGYFEDIAAALDGVREWLLTGPGIAKNEMARHVGQHLPALHRALCGLEASDRPTDGELADQARWAFGSTDRMRPGSVAVGTEQ